MRRTDSISLTIQLTPQQHAALTQAAAVAKKSRATYIRDLIADNVPGFENDIQSRKELERADK